jgi:hypothetical protein
VRTPDEDDWKKLARAIKYLQGCPDLPLTIEADDMQMLRWWVDGSFTVHPDMKSHTGTVMSIGKATQYASSKRQKLNTRSSTEAELVNVDDVLAQVMWTRYFLEEHGYCVTAKTSSIKTTRAQCSWRRTYIFNRKKDSAHLYSILLCD